LPVVTASGLTKRIGARTLFSGISIKLDRGDRMTLSGRNGSGKTTLLRVLAGEAGADGGTVSLGRGVRVALHDQRPPRGEGTLREYVSSGLGWILGIERELAELEARMAEGSSDPATLDAYADAQARLEHAGGYRWRDGVAAALRGLGFDDSELDRSLSTFSGGELTRASLARALASKPDLLLLDEPTNHLDIGSLEWLEGYLREADAAVVLVAHDRWFLEAVGTSVLELEAGRGRFFDGPWHAWRTEKAQRALAEGREIERSQAEIARMERFVERFRYKATKARQAQSKLKRIERVKRSMPTVDPSDSRSLSFSFGDAERSGRVVLELTDGRIQAGDRVLAEDADLWLERGEHVCLIGPNGCGKSTLVATLTGERELPAGKLSVGHNVKAGYLRQHAEAPASASVTVLSHAQRATGLSEAKTRALLGRFLFSGEEVEKPLAGISGGEAQRLALAILVSSDSNLLVLDEPTNHLDAESREALEDALRAFQGTVLLVSHDRALLEAVGSRTVVFEDGSLRSHPGGWVEYRAAEEAKRDGKAPARARKPPRPARASGPSKNRKALIARLEGEVERAEVALRELEDELADPSHWADERSSKRATRRHEAAKARLADLEAEWERAVEGGG
jgi:ATP-binding cassette subfamily F protein 3